MPLRSLSPEGWVSPSIYGKAVLLAAKGHASHWKGNFCAYKSMSLCFVCLIIAFCPWPLAAWLSEAGVFSPAVWSRGQLPSLGSRFHSAWAPLCGLQHPAPSLVSETEGSWLGRVRAGPWARGTGTTDGREPSLSLFSEASVTLSAAESQAESCQVSPAPPREPETQVPGWAGRAMGDSVWGAGRLGAPLCPHCPWALPDKPAHTTQAPDKGALGG